MTISGSPSSFWRGCDCHLPSRVEISPAKAPSSLHPILQPLSFPVIQYIDRGVFRVFTMVIPFLPNPTCLFPLSPPPHRGLLADFGRGSPSWFATPFLFSPFFFFLIFFALLKPFKLSTHFFGFFSVRCGAFSFSLSLVNGFSLGAASLTVTENSHVHY